MNTHNYSLVGIDGNAYCIMAYVTRAMRQCGKTRAEQDAYLADAQSSNYDHLVAVSMDMCEELNNMEE